jgi:hypothetical protein
MSGFNETGFNETGTGTGFNATGTGSPDSGINVVGLVSLLVFYAAVLVSFL